MLESVLILALAAAPAPVNVPDPAIANPRAAVVTEATVLANERFWPYQVSSTSDGQVGVLIRIDDRNLARIDFGRDGKRNIPVSQTDLVARANRVRTGELDKIAPNFTLALGPRLLDSAAEVLHPVPFETVTEKPGFVCVFADPDSADFAAVAHALRSLVERHGVMTILFPQGEHPDPAVRAQLRALHWTVPFVYDHLSESYTLSLLEDGAKLPTLLLVSDEGRVLYQSAWRPAAVPELSSALERAFGGTPATAMTDR